MRNTFQRLWFILLLMMSSAAWGQQSPNIRINEALLKDLQDAAAKLHLDGVVVIGDTISLESNFALRSLSLFLYCNYLQNGEMGINISPNLADSVTFSADGPGLPGKNVSIYSTLPVTASVNLLGGAGNQGKNGRKGRDGVKPASIRKCCSSENIGEAGQAGATGFPGGSGGKVVVRTVATAPPAQIIFSGRGGKGGPGGIGGIGGMTYSLTAAAGHPNQLHIQARKEADGATGAIGPAGATIPMDIQTISRQAFIDELRQYGVETLGGSQPAFTTLISLAPKTRPGGGEVSPDRPTTNETR